MVKPGRDAQRFLYGDILAISQTDILWLMALFVGSVIGAFITALAAPRRIRRLGNCAV